jgi:hypothetical protein
MCLKVTHLEYSISFLDDIIEEILKERDGESKKKTAKKEEQENGNLCSDKP